MSLEYSFSANSTISFIDSRDIFPSMDIYRGLSYFPSWSSASKNFYGNASKLLSSQSLVISESVLKSPFIAATIGETNIFGMSTEKHYALLSSAPREMNTEYGVIHNMGEEGSASIESSVIMKIIELSELRHLDVSMSGVRSENMDMVIATKAYAYPSETPYTVELSGIDRYRNEVSETVEVSNVVEESLSDYLFIKSIVSDNPECRISNSIDLSEHHSYRSSMLGRKMICNRDGVYFEPRFELSGNTITVYDNTLDVFEFQCSGDISSLFIGEFLDVIAVRDNEIVASKLMLDYGRKTNTNSSVNNNVFIQVDNEESTVGSVCTFSVNTPAISEVYDGESIRISIENRGLKYFLGMDGVLREDPNTWLSLSDVDSRISISVEVENFDPYIGRVDFGRSGSFMNAMTVTNSLHFIPTGLKDVDSLIIVNGNLVAKKTDGRLVETEFIRSGFTTSGNATLLPYKFNEIEEL